MANRTWLAFLVLALAALCAPAEARKLYAATAHDGADGHSAGVLYVVDPHDGRSRMIGPIRLGAEGVAVDGLAVHPKSGVLYAITAGIVGDPRLITIDTHSGRATLVGPLGARGADLQFDAKGTLYTWLCEASRLGVVDIATGSVRPLGKTEIPPSLTAGLALNSQGLAMVASRLNKGVIDEVDPATGTIVGGIALIDASIINAVNALTVSPGGAIMAVNTSKEGRRKRELVSIDPETGTITRIGALPDDVDALAFDHDPREIKRSNTRLLLVMLGIFIALNVAGWYRWRKTG